MRKMYWLIVGIGGILGASLFVVAQGNGQGGGADENSRIQIGYSIMQASAIPLDLTGKNRALVGLGAYIVNAQADCNGCHGNPTFNPNNDPFAGDPGAFLPSGYLVGGSPIFGPVFVPRNITPDKNGLPAGLTLVEFKYLLRTGQDPDPTGPPPDSPILQVMPWPIFRHMTDHDLGAVYEFLSAIPCLEGNQPGRCG